MNSIREWKSTAFLLVTGCLFSFPIVMNTLAPYDDEGYVMMTIQTFGNGERLYGSTHTQYGPAFYFLTESLHRFLGVPLTQDGVRLKTIFIWCASTMFCYAAMRRLKVVREIAWICAFAFHIHLDKLALEPGHPQEWILLLNAVAIWLVSGTSNSKWAMAAACVALIGMIKLNWGAVSGVALILQAAIADTREARGRLAWTQVAVAGLATSVTILILTWLAGSSWQEISWGLVGQHRRFTSEFYHAIPWHVAAMVFLITSVSLWMLRSKMNADRTALNLSVIGLSGGIVLALMDFARPLVHGLEPRGAAPWLVLAGPALIPWLFTKRRMESCPLNAQFSPPTSPNLLSSKTNSTNVIWFLAVLTLLGPLTAYPTPGTQLTIATAPSWIFIALLMSAALRRSTFNSSVGEMHSMISKPSAAWFAKCAAIFVLLAMAAPLWVRWCYGESLSLQGTYWIRLESKCAERERAIADAILRTDCKYLVFDGHTHNRFYFWLGKVPLTAANPTFWPRMLTDVEKAAWQKRMRSLDRLCVVRPPESELLASDFARELRTELLANWRQTATVQGWQIGIVETRTD